MQHHPNQLPINPEDEPYYRALRRQIALALLFSPTMCVLPFLAIVAQGTGVAGIIWGVWGLISFVLVIVVWRAASLIRKLTEAAQNSNEPPTYS